jgi:Aldehyde ferredoxin oxidoreductase, domains 2 & 3
VITCATGRRLITTRYCFESQRLLGLIPRREGEVADLLTEGVLRAARSFERRSDAYAVRVKGLEMCSMT